MVFCQKGKLLIYLFLFQKYIVRSTNVMFVFCLFAVFFFCLFFLFFFVFFCFCFFCFFFFLFCFCCCFLFIEWKMLVLGSRVENSVKDLGHSYAYYAQI